jgi:drug/metabolite transporter, DME family
MFQSTKGFIFVMLAAALWGTSGIVSKMLYALSATNAFSVAFLRLGIAAPIFLMAGFFVYKRALFHIPKRDLLLMAFTGAMLAVFQLCYFAAVNLAGVTVATLVTICTSPILVLLITLLLGHEQVTRNLIAALALVLIGTPLLVGIGGEVLPTTVLQGVLLSVASALGYAAMTLTGRNIATRYPSLQVNAVVFSVGAVLLFVVALGNGLVLSYPLQGWVLLLYLGLVPSVLGYALFVKGLQTTPASVVSILTLLEPLTATLLAYLLFDEQLGITAWVGAFLIVVAMIVLSRNESQSSQTT